MPDFLEVATRVWVARYAWADANVIAVGGARGLVVIDTHASLAAGRQVVNDVQRLGAGEVIAVVNTHAHWDHVFGNGAFREAYAEVPIFAHENCITQLAEDGERVRTELQQHSPEHANELAETPIVVPNRSFSSVASIDLGDRSLELIFPGRGHTAGDLVLTVPDADVLLAGDLIEESANPWIGEDSWPLDWPLTLDLIAGLIGEASVVVPGHGLPVDREFVARQRAELGLIAETVRHLANSGVSVNDAVAAGEWPWETDERIQHAVRRGYEQLPRSQKRLPLL